MAEQNIYVLDIETNGLLADMLDYSSFPYKLREDARLWCIVVRNLKTNEVFKAVKEEATKEWLQGVLHNATHVVAHNGFKFDWLALKLFGIFDYHVGYLDEEDTMFGKPVLFIDSLILSRLFNPDRFGGHSLEAWGERLGESKTDFRQLCIDKGYIDKNAPKGAEFREFCPEMVHYCITPDMRLLGKDLIWKAAEKFAIGDKILGFSESIRGDHKGRRYEEATIEIINEDFAEVFEVKLESGKVLKVTKEHRFLVCRENHGDWAYSWVETQNLRAKDTSPKFYSKLPALLPVYEKEESYDAGWLGGIFDGEGSLSNGNKRLQGITVAQNPTLVLDKIEFELEKRGIAFSKRYTKKEQACRTIRITGGLVETYKTLSLFRPERLIKKLNFNHWGRLELKASSFADGVVSIKSIGVQKILKIQTSSRTFICEGYPMHNCEQDTLVTALALKSLTTEKHSWGKWNDAIKVENKLADLAVRREHFGFSFDKELAVKCVEDLTAKMQELADRVNPILPPKKMNKGEMDEFTPAKTQFTKAGTPSSHLLRFCKKVGAEIELNENLEYSMVFEGRKIPLPCNEPIKTHIPASIDNLDHVKSYLIELGWVPIEWRERDLTKDSKKQNIPYEKRVAALKRWATETHEGKYKEQRMAVLGITSIREFYDETLEKLKKDKPVRVPTSPCVRVGVEKELCPNLTALGESVDFAKDFTLYLTYRHRKNSIAGGDIEDMDFDLETPNTGYLAQYREVDGRIPTPAIELGAVSNRYRHLYVVNVPRPSSVYGHEMRSLFGCGKGFVQLGFDFSSLEARIMGHYAFSYPEGEEMSKMLLAEKPDDWHSVTARKLDISRTDTKSVNYGLIYGAQPLKISKMVRKSLEEGERIYEGAWNAMPALKALKEDSITEWEDNNKTFVVGIDGRKIMVRSSHSILNSKFQSGGVICTKYTTVKMMQKFEQCGYNIDPFVAKPDVGLMIEMHDESQLAVDPKLIQYKIFNTEEEGKEFVKNYDGIHQIAPLNHGKKWYVALPNKVSIAIGEAIEEVCDLLKLKVKLGYEWQVGSNWAQTH